MNRFEVVNISSDHSFGAQIGTRYKNTIVDQMTKHQARHPDDYAVSQAVDPYITSSVRYVESVYRQLYEMAKASGVPLNRLFHTFVPELEEKEHWLHGPATAMRCTTLVRFNEKGEAIIGHNEDWEDGEPSESLAYVVTPSYTGLWYKGEGLGSAIGVNKFGIWHCTNQVSTQPLDAGVPRLLTAWHLTGLDSVAGIINFIRDTPQASAYTYVLVAQGEVTRIEHSHGVTAYRQSRDRMVSTNHLVYPELLRHQREVPMNSGTRYSIGTEFARADMSPDDMIAFLAQPEISRPETLASVVVFNNEMQVCYGRPVFGSEYVPYPVGFAGEQL